MPCSPAAKLTGGPLLLVSLPHDHVARNGEVRALIDQLDRFQMDVLTLLQKYQDGLLHVQTARFPTGMAASSSAGND